MFFVFAPAAFCDKNDKYFDFFYIFSVPLPWKHNKLIKYFMPNFDIFASLFVHMVGQSPVIKYCVKIMLCFDCFLYLVQITSVIGVLLIKTYLMCWHLGNKMWRHGLNLQDISLKFSTKCFKLIVLSEYVKK